MAASRIFGKNAEMSRIWQPVEPKARKTSGNPDALRNFRHLKIFLSFDEYIVNSYTFARS